MIEYYFEVKHQYIEGPDNATFISGSAEIYSAVFHFDSTWDGFSKTAVFKCGEKRVEQLLVNDKCTIPQEMLDEAKKYFCVGVYGVNGSTRMPTVYSDNYFILPGAEPSETARDFPPDIFDQIVEIGQQAAGDATSANAAKNVALAALGEMHSYTASSSTLPSGTSATAEYNNKHFSFGIPQGEKGDQGDIGETGPQGPAGKSAYESAQNGGYVGTEEQFNADLSMASSKQNVADSSLTTANKTVVGAINELEQGKVSYAQGIANAGKTMKVNVSGNVVPVAEPQYELIEEIILTEAAKTITRTQEPNGNTYNLHHIKIFADVNGVSSTQDCTITLWNENEEYADCCTYGQINPSQYRFYIAAGICYAKGYVFSQTPRTGRTIGYAQNGSSSINEWSAEKIIRLRLTASTEFPAGTIIKIYAIRN